ncbi:envelope glycoprotein [Kasokero virus]|uniref:M polyprotein n=1 Tax=Kasokero virus TaxID=1712570 RepID=A0A0M4LB14_9VIRU|nr:envelope glycoprotein [Kasokero virus]ALD84350.1 envelope glycoprotein [Kasokero virus]QNS29908.1 envelope glycoprotein [Kasokero virus]
MLLSDGVWKFAVAIVLCTILCTVATDSSGNVTEVSPTQGKANSTGSAEGSSTTPSLGPKEGANSSEPVRRNSSESTTVSDSQMGGNKTGVSTKQPTPPAKVETATPPAVLQMANGSDSGKTTTSGPTTAPTRKKGGRPGIRGGSAAVRAVSRVLARVRSGERNLVISREAGGDLQQAREALEEAVMNMEIDNLALEQMDEETTYRSVQRERLALPQGQKFAYEEEHEGEVMLVGKLSRYTRFERVDVDNLDSLAKFSNHSSVSTLTLCTHFGHYYNATTKGTTTSVHTQCDFNTQCKGIEEHVQIEKVANYDNIKILNILELPVIIIAYFTRHFGFTYSNLVMHEQIENCLFFHPLNPVACMKNSWSSRSYPVVHFVIERKFLKSDSSITLCGLKKGNPTGMKGTWFAEKHRLTIDLGDPEVAGRRRLLGLEKRKRPLKRQDIRCHSGSHLVKVKKYAATNEYKSFPDAKVGFCNDSMITNLPIGHEFGCYRVGSVSTHIQCKPYHNAYDGEKDCNVTSTEDCEQDMLCAEVKLNGQGIVTARTQLGEVQLKHCLEKCHFGFKKVNDLEVYFTCPDGKQHRLHSNAIDANCPFQKHLGKYALYACRATHRPIMLYTVIAWLTVGVMALSITLQVLSLLIRTYCYFVICVKAKLDRGKGKCPSCNDMVNSSEEWQRHQNCKRGKCPYCGTKGSEIDLRKHANVCLQKETVLEHDANVLNIRRTPRLALRLGCLVNSLQGKPTRLTWFVVLLCLFCLLIRPVSSFRTNLQKEGAWEEGIEEVEYCKQDCWFENDICMCEKETGKISRRILSVEPSKEPHKHIAPGTKKILRSIDVEAPWGTLHIPETFSPAGSAKHISLSWESSKLVGNRVVLSGKSTAILKLNPRTSTSWEMSSPDANEKKVLTLSILDYTQIYSSRFEYITGDRKVSTWSEGSCTGPCPKNCGCDDPSCHTREWLNSRNWRCNPTWCWGIGTGCSCCSAQVVDLYESWLVSIWQIEHIRTPVVACLEFDHENRVCEVVEAGIEIQLGPVTVAFSDPFGEQKLLPKRIAVYHKRDSDHEHVDLLHNHGIGGAEQYCKLQSCTHGTAGDYQILNPDALVFDDITSINYFKKIDAANKVWMSWEGVNLGYYCNPGDWTTCTAENVVVRNSEAFQNRNNLERNYSVSHFFHSSRIYGAGKTLSMDLKGRPVQSGGNINVYITVNNLELNSKKVNLQGIKVALKTCSGCFGCNLGAECQVSLAISEPEEFHLHLRSRTPGVTVPDTSFLVISGEEKVFRIRVFSIQKTGNFCVEILESKHCPDCKGEDLVSCVGLELEDPKPVLLEHRSVLFSKSNQTCEGGVISCWAGSAGNLFKGIGSFLSSHFGSIFKGLLMAVLPVLLIAGGIFFSPQIISFLRLFKRGRSVVGYRKKGYRPLTEEKDLDLTAEEKAFLSGIIGKKKE